MAMKRKLRSTEPEPEPEPEPNEEEEESESESEESESESESEEEEESEEEPEEDDEEEDLSNRETLRTLLEPFGKDQLIELLKEAAARNPSLISRISESTESDPAHRKIFVYGLGWDCNTETLAAAFRPFGDIEECRVVADRTTGRSKGYGFVLFRTCRGARNALKEPQKVIGRRPTSCQLASKGNSPAAGGGGGGGRKVPEAMMMSVVSTLPPNDLALAYASTHGNPAGGLLGQGMGVQSGGVGLLNQVAGDPPSVNRTVTPTSYGAGPGVNTVSPSVIGSYQSQAALQGLGGYQLQSTMNPGMRSQSSLGSSGFGLPSYLGR